MRSSPALTLTALIILNVLSIVQAFECVHHMLQHEKQTRSHQKYSRTSPIQLRGAHEGNNRRDGHAPMRLRFDTSQLGVNIEANQKAYIERVLAEAKTFIESQLKVIPVEGNLFFARPCRIVWTSGPNTGVCAQDAPSSALQCGTMSSIPANHLAELRVVDEQQNDYTLPGGSGLANTDLLVYVTASQLDEICLESDALAYANSCQRDQFDRPVIAYINFCSGKVDVEADTQPRDHDVKLALHELTHILGMSQSSYPFWREQDGTPRTARCPDNPLCGLDGAPQRAGEPPQNEQGSYIADENTLRRIPTASGTREAIVTPTVQRVVREHFNCSELQGAELEDAGGEGTQLSHWEKRIFFSEYMTGSTQTGSQSVVSAVTLALLQDTGWYQLSLAAGGSFKWGLDQGCPFVQDTCPNMGCSDGGVAAGETSVCAFDRSAIGYCDKDPLMDGCTSVLPYVDQECAARDHVKIRVKCEGADCLGSYFGEGSACFESSLKLDGFEAPYTSTVSCYKHRCSVVGGKHVLEVQTPDDKWHTCQEGELLEAKGYGGRILCPETGQLCGPFTGPALPDAKEAIPLGLDNNKKAPLDFITKASAQDWALYAGAGGGALGVVCLCTALRKWRKRHAKTGGGHDDGDQSPAAQLAFDGPAGGPGGRRTSAELEFEAALEASRVQALREELARDAGQPVPRMPSVNDGEAQLDNKSACTVM